MEKIVFKNIYGINIAANVYCPENEIEEKCPVVIVSGPNGSTKEQCAGLYAEKMAKNGYISIAFDPAFYGESDGNPRYLLEPNIEVENVSAAIDFIISNPRADRKKIAILGVAEGGGYAVKAAMLDRRIEAVSVVAPINYGRFIRTESEKNALNVLKKNARKRTENTANGDTEYIQLIPDNYKNSKDIDQRESWDYYNDENRGKKGNWENKIISRCLDKAAGFDAFYLADKLLTVPLDIIVGEIHGSFGSYKDADILYELAASKKKEYVTMRESTQISLYDDKNRVDKTVEMICEFLKKYL